MFLARPLSRAKELSNGKGRLASFCFCCFGCSRTFRFTKRQIRPLIEGVAVRANLDATHPDRASPGSRIRAHPRYAGTASQPYISLSLAPSRRSAAGCLRCFPQATHARSPIALPTESLLLDNAARLSLYGMVSHPWQQLRGICICGKQWWLTMWLNS
jgi:hypothetical protein